MNPASNFAQVLPVAPLFSPGISGVSPASQGDAANGAEFRSILQTAIQKVETSSVNATNQMEQFMTGESSDLHNVALATQKAALDFEMFLQVRNKVVSAYQEVMRLQI